MDRLFSKLYGCEAAGRIANSMGDVTEGSTFAQIREKYGFLDKLIEQDKSARTRWSDPELEPSQGFHAHHRPAGMGEDGQERHKLTVNAILRKNGRINVVDLARTWVRDIDESKFGYLLGTQDKPILHAIKAGIKPWEVGRHAYWPGFIGTAKGIVPIGMVNAGNPEQAAQDAYDVARLKDTRGRGGNYALDVAAGFAAATAEAFKPGATVDSIIETATAYLPHQALDEVKQGLAWAAQVKDWTELAPLYEDRYRYQPGSNAVEVMSRSLALFKLAGGKLTESILWPVNIGRDCDCTAFFSASFAGAMHGIEAVPGEWLEVIENAAKSDPYSVSRLTAKETAEGMHKAVLAVRDAMKNVTDTLDSLAGDSTVKAPA